MKKFFKFIGFLLLLILIYVIITLQLPFSFASKKTNDSYDNVLGDAINNMDAKIVDIALLGSHDAFSDGISYTSKPNVNEGGIVTNKLVNILCKGLVVKMSKAQVVGAKEQLYAGVRYFDVRVTKVDSEYYTCHGYLSNPLSSYLKDIVEFLDSHPGEFIIFDIQHFYADEEERENDDKEYFDDLIAYIDSVKSTNGNSLIDFVSYDATTQEIGSLTYGMLTNNKTKAGVILLGKTKTNSLLYYRDNDANYGRDNYDNIFSFWHQTNSIDTLLIEIDKENTYLTEHDYSNILRVNQAQRTGYIMDKTIVKSIFEWSILNMAKKTNKNLIKDEDSFKNNLKTMPIFMVDYVTTNANKFNELANKYISEFNQGL